MARVLMIIAALALASLVYTFEDVTLLHVTDLHVPHALAQTRETLAALPFGEPIELQPYGVTVPAPGLVLSTGDLNEFSGGSGWWEQYLNLWADCPVPVYHQLGNHDNTWRCARPKLRDLHGSAFYAFERAGIKFIGWDTATPQDPRPSIAEEGVRWLEGELDATPADQPIVFFCHHAPDGREFAGAYDRARLLDLLQTRNVALVLVGHGHSARAWRVEGLDVVMGGSTFGARPGFGIVSVMDGVLRVCHRYVDDTGETVALLEKPLPERSAFLPVAITPADGTVFEPETALRWTVTAEGAAARGTWTLDGDTSGTLRRAGGAWVALLDRESVQPGAHTLRAELADTQGRVTGRTVSFYVNGGTFDVQWRENLGGSCQSAPLVAGGRVFVGDNSGALTILSATDGAHLGSVETAGEVRSGPVMSTDGQTIVFGSADGIMRAISPEGEERWSFDAESAIYGGATIADGRVIFGTADGEVIALEAAAGACAWRSQAAEYAIEQAPCAGDGMVFAGSWDRHAYALDAATGAVRWRRPSAGSDREGFVAWYYSPADCPPVFAGENVFFADRAYRLTVFDGRTGGRVLDEEKCVAVGPSADARFVYARHTDGRVSKRGADGEVVWSAEAPTGAVATPPVEAHGVVWVISDRGVLSALDAETGRVLAQQRVTPELFAFAAPAFDGERVYIADMSGRVTCLSANLR